MNTNSRRPSIWAIVVGAGEGRRYGAAKQYEPLGDSTVLARSVVAARSVAEMVVAVIPPSRSADPGAGCGADVVVPGGATRSASVRAGLSAVPDSVEIIVVHDAARPLATSAVFSAVIQAVLSGADGAVPGVALTDTVKVVNAGYVVETLDRSSLIAVQTPQGFRASSLREAHAGGVEATDDAALLEQRGRRVVVVPGEVTNIKITDPADLEEAERMFSERTAAST